jgi:glyoxylase-like metal-dependent hydrolase (beta-lactamase superfamily II)
MPVVEPLGLGCHAWMRLPGSWGQSNIGLVVGDGASLLIDTPWDVPLTRSMLAAFSGETDGNPISLVFNTHGDIDHWWGNCELPGAEVLASDAAIAQMREEMSPARLALLKRLSSVGGLVPGRVGGGGRYLAREVLAFDIESVKPRFPERRFTGRRSETVGGREVEFVELGPAHSASDSVVLVPDARVAFTGDLLFAGVTPVMWHGPVSGWLSALEAIMALDADTFVPGHGPLSSRAELGALHGYWSWLAEAVAAGGQAGEGVMEIAKRLIRAPRFAAFREWQNPERIYVNVVALERGLRGAGPIPANPIDRGRAFDGVACICQELRDHRL